MGGSASIADSDSSGEKSEEEGVARAPLHAGSGDKAGLQSLGLSQRPAWDWRSLRAGG